MADLSDVENALVSTIAAALYSSAYQPGAYQASLAQAPWPPAGPGQPQPGNVPVTVKLYRGWPESATLLADVNAGKAHVSVFSEAGMTRDTSRYWPGEFLQTEVPPTLTTALSGNVLTLGGSATAGNVVGVQVGAPAAAYAYAVQAGDTVASIAASLAAKIPGASVVGTVITLPTDANATAGAFAPQNELLTDLRRQDQGFRISAWAPTPAARDAIVSLIDAQIAGLRDTYGNLTRFMPLADGTAGWIRYAKSYVNDMPARDRVWRRDLCYHVEYETTLIEQVPTMLFGGGTLSVGSPAVATETFGASPPS